jgi:TetR/AcrR family transcriptional regulator, fatty acid metabolism regulator protein
MASKRDKHSLILDAGLKVFAEHGYHAATTAKIAKEAGVAEGTIYRYFKNKEEVLAVLLKEQLNYLVNIIRDKITDEDSAEVLLWKICKYHLVTLENRVDVALLFQNELRQKSPELRKEINLAVRPYFDMLEYVLQKGIDEGTFRNDLDVKLTRRLIFGALDDVVAIWLASGANEPISDDQIEKVYKFFIRGVQ